MQKAMSWTMRGRSEEYLRRVTAGEGADGLSADVLSFRPPRKLYRVSEVADCLGVSRQTIHNYATAGLITEEGHTPGGQRLFGETVFREILLIQHLKPTHRLQEIRHILASRRLVDVAAEQPTGAMSNLDAARRRERSRELLGLAHLDETGGSMATEDVGGLAADSTLGIAASGTIAAQTNPPADAMTRAEPDAASHEADRTAVGPDFAVRAPSDEPPPAGPATPERSQAMPGQPPSDQHVKETPEDDPLRG
jgi:DNA-binding transcriptional MerR regulator